MTTMCHVCGSDRGTLNGVHCRICQSPFCQECEKRDSSSAAFGGDHLGQFCGSCLQKLARDSFSGNISSHYTSTLTSPALSLSSYGSCTSSCGDSTSFMSIIVFYRLLCRIFWYCILQVFHFNFYFARWFSSWRQFQTKVFYTYSWKYLFSVPCLFIFHI